MVSALMGLAWVTGALGDWRQGSGAATRPNLMQNQYRGTRAKLPLLAHVAVEVLTSLADCFVNELKALWEVAHQVCGWRILNLQDHVREKQRVAREKALCNLRSEQG